LSVYLSVCLSICLSVYLSVCLPAYRYMVCTPIVLVSGVIAWSFSSTATNSVIGGCCNTTDGGTCSRNGIIGLHPLKKTIQYKHAISIQSTISSKIIRNVLRDASLQHK
jgi:hypothetical protein